MTKFPPQYNIPPSNLTEKESEEVARRIASIKAERTPKERRRDGISHIEHFIKGYLNASLTALGKELNYSMAAAIKDYLKTNQLSQASLARDLDIHVTRMSNILHGRAKINSSIAFRLEAHSTIPAELWMRLQQKEELDKMMSNQQLREESYKRVKNKASGF